MNGNKKMYGIQERCRRVGAVQCRKMYCMIKVSGKGTSQLKWHVSNKKKVEAGVNSCCHSSLLLFSLFFFFVIPLSYHPIIICSALSPSLPLISLCQSSPLKLNIHWSMITLVMCFFFIFHY